MSSFRKKPVVIEAFQYDGDFMDCVGEFYIPEWARKAVENGTIEIINYHDGGLSIKTLEGNMHASVGDYVIKGVNDEIYPCKPDIFDKTYEPA